MCILLNVKKHEKTFALNVDIFKNSVNLQKDVEKRFILCNNISECILNVNCGRKGQSDRRITGGIK